MTVTGRCASGHEAELGRLCPKCVVEKYRRLEEAEARIAELKRVGTLLAKRLDAKDALLAAYRTGATRTPEKALDTLASTQGVEAEWAALTTPPEAQP